MSVKIPIGENITLDEITKYAPGKYTITSSYCYNEADGLGGSFIIYDKEDFKLLKRKEYLEEIEKDVLKEFRVIQIHLDDDSISICGFEGYRSASICYKFYGFDKTFYDEISKIFPNAETLDFTTTSESESETL